MRVLFTTWAWPSHYFPVVPLARALLEAGHEVRAASSPALAAVIAASGVPALKVGADVDLPALAHAHGDPATAWTRGPYPFDQYLAVAEAMVDDLVSVARTWRPDLVVYEPTAYAGPLAAGMVGVPAVRHLWGPDFTFAARRIEPAILASLCRRLGLDGVRTLGALTVDPCPPSMQIPGDYARQRMRFIPYNGVGAAPGWLPAPGRPVVCVTWGTTLARLGGYPHLVGATLTALDDMDVELVAAVSPYDRDLLGPLPQRVRVVESVPLHLLLPACAVLIHPGGPGTMLTAIAAGVPQLFLPCLPEQPFYAHRVVANGAGLALNPAKFTAEAVRQRVGELLSRPGLRRAAEGLRSEMARQPSSDDVIAALVDLAGKVA
jgi:UDP:flavonoid glycosyltransferase YjiC (YdhE family)